MKKSSGQRNTDSFPEKACSFRQNNSEALMKSPTTNQSPHAEKKKLDKLTLLEIPETCEIEISKENASKESAKRIRFPKENWKRFGLKPEKFKQTQEALNKWNLQEREERAVYATSLESCVGYDSLFRVIRTVLSDQIAYYRSEEAGALSFEEARERVFGKEARDEKAVKELFERVMTIPVNSISFWQLSELARDSPATAENVWEWIKSEAAGEFESGHFAADSLEPLGRAKEAWTRASFIAIRESFCEEYKPQGAIETSMIDLLAQSYFMVQYWTKELTQRMMSEPRRLPQEYLKQKEWHRKANPKSWEEEKWNWEIPTLSESEAIEQAARMLDRFQRMYFRALRQLRDWRRYAPQVTINNPKQVNIATDGGQQINVSDEDD